MRFMSACLIDSPSRTISSGAVHMLGYTANLLFSGCSLISFFSNPANGIGKGSGVRTAARTDNGMKEMKKQGTFGLDSGVF